MDKEHFDQLMKAVCQMSRHMARKVVPGVKTTVKTTELPEPNIRAIHKAAQISQSQFARLLGVNLRTLQNLEHQGTGPSGPARVLLKIVASHPKSQIEALNA
ncbi:MAG: hypothetical protein ABL878_17945 [Burkholderiales bacterium]